MPLQLHYAADILAGVISTKLQNGLNGLDELNIVLNLIMEGYVPATAAIYALVHGFLWERFG